MKDYFIYQGGAQLITGSRDATREAFNKGLLERGEIWMEMIQSRNQTSHTYNKKTANEIVDKIKSDYFTEISAFYEKMKSLSKTSENE
jgi:nucleotidyltransferase substrate binding protein (TIGR01987 family)